jgi:hypothetical protein
VFISFFELVFVACRKLAGSLQETCRKLAIVAGFVLHELGEEKAAGRMQPG